MRRFRIWIGLVVIVPLMLLIGGGLIVLKLSKEPELNGQPLSEHLLKLQQSDAEVRASTFELIAEHSSLFGPFCLDLVANEPTSMERSVDRFQTKYGATVVGRKLGLRSPLKKFHARAMAVAAFRVLHIPEKEKLAALKLALLDEDRQLRMEASKALAQLGTVSLPALEGCLMDRNPGIRNAGLYGLYLIGSDAAPALDSLIKLLKHDVFNVDPLMFEVFGRIGESSVPVLVGAMDKAEPPDKARLLRALVPLGRHLHDHRKVFIAELQSSDAEVRMEAAKALMAAGFVDAKTTALLFPLLKDPEPNVRLTALKLLNAKVPYVEPALESLIALLTDDLQEIREMSGFVIQRIPLDMDASKVILNAAKHSEFAYVREVAERRLSKSH